MLPNYKEICSKLVSSITPVGPALGESGTPARVTAKVGLVTFPAALEATTIILKIFPGGDSPVMDTDLISGRLVRPAT